ncbi:hypothetical protein [Bifidobacterium animalis]|uniref:hypothetical protein n=1 Tax=Bifidobacterium animalis TaxID=28025 RepID=UPI00101FAEDB|nr:hypothetical protein [Bifidobacterium animalis]
MRVGAHAFLVVADEQVGRHTGLLTHLLGDARTFLSCLRALLPCAQLIRLLDGFVVLRLELFQLVRGALVRLGAFLPLARMLGDLIELRLEFLVFGEGLVELLLHVIVRRGHDVPFIWPVSGNKKAPVRVLHIVDCTGIEPMWQTFQSWYAKGLQEWRPFALIH